MPCSGDKDYDIGMRLLVVLALAFMLGPAVDVAAQKVKPLEDILKDLPKQYSGRVLDTRLKGETYQIRVLLRSGEVVELVVDGVTGKVEQSKTPGG